VSRYCRAEQTLRISGLLKIMQRVLEPELMEDPAQAAAYAAADFSEPHGYFIEKFHQVFPGAAITGDVLDLGCGAADICIRFARAYTHCVIDGVDGSQAMLDEGQAAVTRSGLQHRIRLIRAVIPGLKLPKKSYQAIISNSLLHHLHNPSVLWQSLKSLSGEETLIFIMDLQRPASAQHAAMLVKTYSGDEPEILRRDFYNSLCAALTPEEITLQFVAAGIQGLLVETITDRHLLVYGKIKSTIMVHKHK
jgi:SAM-dependent methyltransferase